jgi:hypothetical protein
MFTQAFDGLAIPNLESFKNGAAVISGDGRDDEERKRDLREGNSLTFFLSFVYPKNKKARLEAIKNNNFLIYKKNNNFYMKGGSPPIFSYRFYNE